MKPVTMSDVMNQGKQSILSAMTVVPKATGLVVDLIDTVGQPLSTAADEARGKATDAKAMVSMKVDMAATSRAAIQADASLSPADKLAAMKELYQQTWEQD